MEKFENISLDELLENRVSEETENLTEEIEKKSLRISELNTFLVEKDEKITSLENDIKSASNMLLFADKIKEKYKLIKRIPETEDNYEQSELYLKYKYISNVLSEVFEIKAEYEYYNPGYSHFGLLALNLAINYYKHKTILIALINVLYDCSSERTKIVGTITDFIMPYNYTEKELIPLLKKIDSHTNGCYDRISSYWVESGGKLKNIPYNLLLKNPLISKPDIFIILIESIKKEILNFSYLYSIAKHQQFSKEQIQELGETLININPCYLKYREIENFINTNIKDFNKKTLDHFYNLITSDNQYKTFHWEIFPVEYQYKFLLNKNIEDVLKIITEYSCKWTIEEKDIFLKEYYSNNCKSK
jgi:hypothetical protein